MKKKVVALFLAVLFCLSLIPFAYAEETEVEKTETIIASGECGSSVYWKITSDYTLVIFGTGEMDNYSGVADMPWEKYKYNLVNCIVESGVTSIGNSAFCLNKFKTIELPDTLKTIGEYAFQDASNLGEVRIPDSVVLVGQGAFFKCTSLKNVTLSKNQKTLSTSMFADCSMLTEITIPEGVVAIPVNTFQRCTLLSKVLIPASLREIGSYAFDKCYAISDVYYSGTQNERESKLAIKTTGNSYLLEANWHYSDASAKYIVEWNSADVKYKGATAYVVANGKAQTPRFTVKDGSGNVISASNYDYVYKENTKAGTGYVIVTLKNGYSGTAQGTFKIYLPPTTATTVANVNDGVKITWKAVPDAAGYVIYRRAWNLSSSGWTTFERWNNTTATTWTDTKVYAGTRYQYGVKAYFAQRTDPVSGAVIGGAMDNYNLGIVGPLKTTVRITTRTLNSVTGGTKQITVKWSGSSVFTGYQVQIATDSAFTQNKKTVTISDAKTVQTVIKNLKTGTTYYVRVRSYHEFNGMTYFGEWSNVLSAKTK